MCKTLIVNSASIHSIGLEVRMGNSTSNYVRYVLLDDGTQGDNGEFEYPAKGGWIIEPIDPGVDAWIDGEAGIFSPIDITDFAFAGAVTVTTNLENMIGDALDLSSGWWLTRGDSTDPDGTFQDFVDQDEGQPTTGRIGHVTTQSGIIFVFGGLFIGRTELGSVANPTVFNDSLRTLVFPGGRTDVGWNRIECDISHASTDIDLSQITVEGRGRVETTYYFDTELEVTGGATDTITLPGHDLSTGDFVTYSIEGGTVLGGLTDGDSYFVRRVDANTIALFAIGTAAVGRQNSFSDTSRVSLTPAGAGTGESHKLLLTPDTRPDLIVTGQLVVAAGDQQTGGLTVVETSTDLINWTSETVSTLLDDTDWLGVANDGTTFVAVGIGLQGDQVMTSTDGSTWTARSLQSTDNPDLQGVVHGEGVFVAVADNLTGSETATYSSTDGITWTRRTSDSVGKKAVAYGDGTFVAVRATGANPGIVHTSADGLTWTSRTGPTGATWQSIAYGNGTFVIVGTAGAGNDQGAISRDGGVTWTTVTMPDDGGSARSWEDITFGHGIFVACSDTGAERVAWSKDGETWVDGEVSVNLAFEGAEHCQHRFLISAFQGFNPSTFNSSPDGKSWRGPTEEDNDFTALSSMNQVSGAFDADSCIFNGVRRIVLADGATISNSSIIRGLRIHPDGGVVDGCTITSPIVDIGEGYVDVAEVVDLADVKNNTFTSSGQGHAVTVRHASGSTTTSGYVGNTHTGYGNGTVNASGVHDNEFDSTSDVNASTDAITVTGDPFVTGDPIIYSNEGGTANIGLTDQKLYWVRRDSANTYGIFESLDAANTDTNRIALTSTGAETQTLYSANAAIFNNTGKAVTINISGGGDTPSIRNGRNSSTIINNNVNVTFTGLRDNTEIRICDAATGVALAGIENATDGTSDDRSATFSLAAGVLVDIRFAHGIAADGNRYTVPDRNSITDFTWPSTITSLPITQVLDRNYNNPV
jgi:hypothetical protein